MNSAVLKFYWFVLIVIFFGGDSFSLIENSRNRFIARTILKTWLRQAEEQTSRLLLPKDVEVSYTTPQIITHRGYPIEIHHVTTDDGYILELHRIPPTTASTPKKAVFLQHGLSISSAVWLINPYSLAILLAAKGYDVWLGNSRGNRYSRAHVRLSPKSAQFWEFSWDQLANDIPSEINYILQKTGQSKLSVVGHSLGSTMLFIAMIQYPELNDKIDIMIALSPLTSFATFRTPFRHRVAYSIEKFLKRIGTGRWRNMEDARNMFWKWGCSQTYSQARVCRYIASQIHGPERKNIALTLIPRIISHLSDRTSVSVVTQIAQSYNTGEMFQAYDYGENGNLLAYGSNKPLVYNLGKVTAPVYVFSGGNDYIVRPKDIDWLLTQLGNVKGHTSFPEYNHLDFVFGTDVNERVYDQLMALLPSP